MQRGSGESKYETWPLPVASALLLVWIEFVCHCFLLLFILPFCLSSFLFFPYKSPWFPLLLLPLCSDGRQPEPEKAAPFPAVHVGSKLRPSLYSFLSHSPLGAASQSQTTPHLHAREMPHASPQQAQVSMCLCDTNIYYYIHYSSFHYSGNCSAAKMSKMVTNFFLELAYSVWPTFINCKC